MRCEVYRKQLDHLVHMAKSDLRAWQVYAWQRAKELEANPSGLWLGITTDLTQAINGQEKAGESVHQSQTKPR